MRTLYYICGWELRRKRWVRMPGPAYLTKGAALRVLRSMLESNIERGAAAVHRAAPRNRLPSALAVIDSNLRIEASLSAAPPASP